MTILIPRRFNGPPDSGNGGYVAGRVAETLLGAVGRPAVGEDAPWVEVTLRSPPPLDTPYDVSVDGSRIIVTVGDDATLVADATMVDPPKDSPYKVEGVDVIDLDVAAAAEPGYLGLSTHPFPTCWVCGPARPDGYHLQPGLVDGADGALPRTACRWHVTEDVSADEAAPDVPAGDVPAAALWAALDCPGGWTALAFGRTAVLGRIAAKVRSTPSVGDTCIATGRLVGSEGRKAWTVTGVYAADGTEHARALSTWIALPTG